MATGLRNKGVTFTAGVPALALGTAGALAASAMRCDTEVWQFAVRDTAESGQ